MVLRLTLLATGVMSATLVFGLVSLVRFGDGDVAELWSLIGIDFRVAAVLFGLAWVAALWYLGLTGCAFDGVCSPRRPGRTDGR